MEWTVTRWADVDPVMADGAMGARRDLAVQYGQINGERDASDGWMVMMIDLGNLMTMTMCRAMMDDECDVRRRNDADDPAPVTTTNSSGSSYR